MQTSLLEKEAAFFWRDSRNFRALRTAGIEPATQDECLDDLDALALMTSSDRLRSMARATITSTPYGAVVKVCP